jgi:hypothetical protein
MGNTRSWGRRLAGIAALVLSAATAAAPAGPTDLTEVFAEDVDRRLQLPPQETARYAALAEGALAQAWIRPEGPQYLVVVDRDPHVQALLLFWRSAQAQYRLVGAAPVSTGNPGSFDHFATPVGVFEHGPWNADFRAEGTFNANGIRGYGLKGMRVFDFGWQRAPRGWGDGAVMEMRLQMHASDPDALEPRLGTAQSKGCIRIPASLDRLFDHYGVLDAEYEREAREGRELWVLDPAREPVADAGRYLVVVDSARGERPPWSPAPAPRHRRVPR